MGNPEKERAATATPESLADSNLEYTTKPKPDWPAIQVEQIAKTVAENPARQATTRKSLGTIPPPNPGARVAISDILGRLDGVRKKAANSFIARCPAHEDKSPSLAITEKNDRVLIHCFAGCAAADVLAAIGLSLADLYPERLSPQTAAERRELKQLARYANLTAAMNLIPRESIVLLLAADDLRDGKILSNTDYDRIDLAHTRICAAYELLR